MKRIALVLAVLFVMTACAQATEVGFQGALNLANMSGDIAENKVLLGFGGGVFARFTPAPQFFVQPEVLYMMKGTKWDLEILDETLELKFKFNYIEIPVLFGYQFPMQGSVSPAIYVGPALGILMSADAEADGESEDMKDFTKSTDFGLVIGGGVDIKTGEKGKFMLGGRYTLGLSNINDDEEDPDFELKNGVISFFVGYGFPIGQ